MSAKVTKTRDALQIEPIIAFYLFAAANVFSALYAPILDCDEVYNYWEPTHYLRHGYGLQTWEYSPEYSIRSWMYICLHASVGWISSWFVRSKTAEFYAIRIALGLACAACQSKLFSSISRTLSPRIAFIFLVIAFSSPGIFQASTAYLPSSFAMYCNMLAIARLLEWQTSSNLDKGIFWTGVGAILGWPFSAILVVPFVLEQSVMAVITDDLGELVRRIIVGSIECLTLLTVQLFWEVFFYHKPTVVPWNLVKYNLFSGAGRGPEIFGTESADFYIRNLLLNFHVWFVLACLATPSLVLQLVTTSKAVSRFATIRSITFTIPFYLWLGIFSYQAHKEERFMYPVYPFLALNAAMALHCFLSWFGQSTQTSLPGKIPAWLKLVVIGVPLLLAIQVGLLRMIGNISAYNAPLQVYDFKTIVQPSDTVCLGKEWYRFPSSYFLPQGVHAKFIKSEFDGLLPGEFREARRGFGFFPGTHLIPPSMNDQNIPDPSKLIDVKYCSYLVDLSIPGSNGTKLEPNYAADEMTWEKVTCKPFLDTSKTTFLGRLLYIPEIPLLPKLLQRQWGEYCLLKRRSSASI